MAAMLIALAEPLVTLYRAGRFTAEDVPIVAEVLTWWAVALFFFAAYMYVLKTFYSLQDTKTPAWTNVFLTVLQVSLYATLTVGIMQWPGLGIIGIPIADAIFFACSLLALGILLRRKIGGYDIRGVAWTIARISLAALAGGLAAYAFVAATTDLGETTFGFLAQLLVGGLIGLGITYGLALLMRVREVSDGATMLRRVFGRALGRNGDA
jgi:putative peptidoglycan lipid II flippase